MQPQLPSDREIVRPTVPEPDRGGRSAEGQRLLDAAGKVGLTSMLKPLNAEPHAAAQPA